MEQTKVINEIYALYDAYIQKVQELEKNKKITDGLFGITKSPKGDACHDQFAEELGTKLKELALCKPAPDEVCDLLEYMFTIPLSWKEDPMIYWMLAAVHILALDLVPILSGKDAQRLYEQYNRDYHRWERLPAQKDMLKALKAAAK